MRWVVAGACGHARSGATLPCSHGNIVGTARGTTTAGPDARRVVAVRSTRRRTVLLRSCATPPAGSMHNPGDNWQAIAGLSTEKSRPRKLLSAAPAPTAFVTTGLALTQAVVSSGENVVVHRCRPAPTTTTTLKDGNDSLDRNARKRGGSPTQAQRKVISGKGSLASGARRRRSARCAINAQRAHAPQRARVTASGRSRSAAARDR